MSYIQIEEDRNFVRDKNSKGIVNIDNAGLIEYKTLREQRLNEKNKITQCQNDINTLKNELTEIKDSLRLILGKLNKG